MKGLKDVAALVTSHLMFACQKIAIFFLRVSYVHFVSFFVFVRFILSLASCHSCMVIDDQLNILPLSSHILSIEPVAPRSAVSVATQIKL